MAVFAVIGASENSVALHQAIARGFANNYTALIDGRAWAVAFVGSAQELSGKLGITDGSNGSAFVFEIGSYYGRASPAIWTWIKEKWEATSRG